MSEHVLSSTSRMMLKMLFTFIVSDVLGIHKIDLCEEQMPKSLIILILKMYSLISSTIQGLLEFSFLQIFRLCIFSGYNEREAYTKLPHKFKRSGILNISYTLCIYRCISIN